MQSMWERREDRADGHEHATDPQPRDEWLCGDTDHDLVIIFGKGNKRDLGIACEPAQCVGCANRLPAEELIDGWAELFTIHDYQRGGDCLLYTSPSPRD